MRKRKRGFLNIAYAILLGWVLLFPIGGWADDAGTDSGSHGGGYDLELPEGATGPFPSAECLALPQECTDNAYGNSESTLSSVNNCDPKCDVWNPSNTPGFTVSEMFQGDPRNYIHGSWRYPRLHWRQSHPDDPGNEIWRSGTLSNGLVRSIRFPFIGGEVLAGTVKATLCEACGGNTWDRTNAVLVVSDKPGSSLALGSQSGCSATGSNGIQFVDEEILETFAGSRRYDSIKNLYCVMEPNVVHYVTYFPNNANCGASEDCRIVIEIYPSGAPVYWEARPQDESDMLPWRY